jgi:hypothetical protein
MQYVKSCPDNRAFILTRFLGSTWSMDSSRSIWRHWTQVPWDTLYCTTIWGVHWKLLVQLSFLLWCTLTNYLWHISFQVPRSSRKYKIRACCKKIASKKCLACLIPCRQWRVSGANKRKKCWHKKASKIDILMPCLSLLLESLYKHHHYINYKYKVLEVESRRKSHRLFKAKWNHCCCFHFPSCPFFESHVNNGQMMLPSFSVVNIW